MNTQCIPVFSGPLQKNDALFMYGATQPKPSVFAYEQTATEVVYGPSCKIEEEIIVPACSTDGVPLQRRRSGGGTVLLSAGVVVTIIVGDRSGNQAAPWYFDHIHHAMIALLAAEGISNITLNGISDLACNNRKVLGSSLYLGSSPRLFYYQSSLLVSADTTLFNRYLLHPPREPQYRNGRSHHTFCTTLQNEQHACTTTSIATLFNHHLAEHLPMFKTPPLQQQQQTKGSL